MLGSAWMLLVACNFAWLDGDNASVQIAVWVIAISTYYMLHIRREHWKLTDSNKFNLFQYAKTFTVVVRVYLKFTGHSSMPIYYYWLNIKYFHLEHIEYKAFSTSSTLKRYHTFFILLIFIFYFFIRIEINFLTVVIEFCTSNFLNQLNSKNIFKFS